MTKQEVQQRVLLDGKPLGLDKFEWNEEARVFSTEESCLVFSFRYAGGVTFNAGSSCIFDASLNCIFKTGSQCIFDVAWGCTFETGDECVVVRRDVYEVIELEEGKRIRLNPYLTKGYKVIEEKHKIVLDGKEIEISEESYQVLQESLIN